MRSPLIHALASVLLIAFGLTCEPNAQTTISGALTGIVIDQSNAVVPNADIEIKDNAKGTTKLTKTDGEGIYRFFFLAPAEYLLTVTHDGFREQSRTVNVLLGRPVTVNFTLEVAGAKSELTISDEVPLIQAENGDVSTTMNQRQVSEIPNPGNDLTYIVQTVPGVVMNTDVQCCGNGGNFSILGMSGTSYLFTMDGMNANDNSANQYIYGEVMLLGQNQIHEATVVSNGYSGQFGGAAGGNINYITKSGSNEYHGNVQYYWNGSAFNANNWFLKASGQARPFNIANQWAGSFGGPIKKDKLFFFFDNEGLRVLYPQVQFVVIPSPEFEAATIKNIDSDPSRLGPATDAFYKKMFALYNAAPGANLATPGGFSTADPTGCTGFIGPKSAQGQLGVDLPCALHFITSRGIPYWETLVAGRLDWLPSKNDHAFFRLQYDWGNYGVVDPIGSVFDGYVHVPWWQGQIVETHTSNSGKANQFLAAASYFAYAGGVRNSSQTLAAFPTVLNFAPGSFNSLGVSFALGFGRYDTQYQVSDDIIGTWGKHKLGFGANFERILWNDLAQNLAGIRGATSIGVLTAQSLGAFYQGGVDPVSPTTDFTSLTQAFTSQTSLPISFFNFGLYAQDEWKTRPNLTLTLAFRVEHYSDPVCQSRCFARLAGPFESISHDPNQPYNQAILVGQKHAFEGAEPLLWSPRFSFAWQPLSISRSSVLRGGVGIFFDPFPGFLTYSFAGNSPLYNAYTAFGDNLAPNEKTSLFKDVAASNPAFVNGFATGRTLAQMEAIDPNFSPPSFSAAARHLSFPQVQKWSLEWQQGFGSDTSVTLGYFGHHGIHELVQNPNANAFGFGSLPAVPCASPPVLPCYDPRFSGVTQFNANAVSNYNGMVVTFKHQFRRWAEGMFQSSYTYGHALDEVSNGGWFPFTVGSSINSQDPNNLRGAYGPAEYDVRHSLNGSYVVEVPVKTALRGHGPNSLVKGWQISGTIFARTGFPYTVFDFVESSSLRRNNYLGFLYAVPSGPIPSVGPCGEGAATPLAPHPCQPPEFSVAADGSMMPNSNALFVQPTCETGFNTGTLPGPNGPCSGPTVSLAQGRNRFRGPKYFNTDFAIMKNTKLPHREGAMLGIGVQFFNLFNHPNFGFPNNDMSSSTFGQIFYLEAPPTSLLGTGMNASPRMIQLKVQLQF